MSEGIKAIREWVFRDVSNTAATIATGAAATYLSANFDEVAQMAIDHSHAFLSFAAIVFTLGVFFALKIDSVELRKRKIELEHEDRVADEARKIQEVANLAKDKERERYRRKRARSDVLGLDPWQKELLLYLNNEGQTTWGPMDEYNFDERFRGVKGMLEITKIQEDTGGYLWRISLNEYGRLATEVGMDLLEEAAQICKKR